VNILLAGPPLLGGGDFSIGTKLTLDGPDGGITVAGKYKETTQKICCSASMSGINLT